MVSVPFVVGLLGACTPASGGTLYRLRNCETGGNYRQNTAPGYSGAYGFNNFYWRQMGYYGQPWQASPALQDAVASRLLANPGPHAAFPGCAAKLGL